MYFADKSFGIISYAYIFRILKIKGDTKRQAQDTTEKTRDVLSSVVAGQSEETLVRFPKEETMKRYIRNTRQKGNQLTSRSWSQ